MTVCRFRVAYKVLVVGSIAAASLLSWPAPPGLAGGAGVGHTHSHKPATRDEILAAAQAMRDKLVGEGKVAASWKGIEPHAAEIKEFGKKKEWVVTFKDASTTDKSKTTLHVFFSLPGNYLAANFTGK